MKYIQSFYQYPVTFSAIGKTIPARSAQGEMKNIAEVTEKELEKLENCEPFFRELVNKKKYRVLNHIPNSYIPPAKQINDAHAETDKLRAELEAAKAKIAELEGPAKDVEPEAEETISDGATTDDVDSTDPAEEKKYEDMSYSELQDACKAAGIEYKNKKKAELIESLKAFVNQ